VSDPIDIKALDEYLKGGSDISQRYRELRREEVPPELDRRVLDEARAAVASGGGRSRAWLRWGAPVALAASVILAVTVVMTQEAAARIFFGRARHPPQSSLPLSDDDLAVPAVDPLRANGVDLRPIWTSVPCVSTTKPR